MKSTERHELRRNALMELLRNPRELVRRYGLSAIIVLVTALVASYFIYRAAGAEQRKWQKAWLPLHTAVSQGSQEQLRDIAAETKSDPLVRSWAYIRYGELLYNKSQQPDVFSDQSSRTELLSQAVTAFQDALRLGAKYRSVVGQATIGLGLCYENLGQPDKALKQYESLIAQAEDRFAGTVWLSMAQARKAFLTMLPDEKVVFIP
ncbi:MAG: hypothetical protein GWP14_06620 [Actinobacteria bacterium]|nr:hypothetical protein [Actinomycetota bacterium]